MGMLFASLAGGWLGYYLGLQTVFVLFIPAWLLLIILILRSKSFEKSKTPLIKLREFNKFQLASVTVSLIPLPVVVFFPESLAVMFEIELLKHALIFRQASQSKVVN